MGRFENLEFVSGLKIDGFGDLKFGRGHFENCIRPFKKHQKWMQMIPNTISDTFQPIIDFSYGLDVEIRPKLTPGAGTPGTVHYRSLATRPWLQPLAAQPSLDFDQ